MNSINLMSNKLKILIILMIIILMITLMITLRIAGLLKVKW